MSHTLLFGFDEKLAQWACSKIPWASYDPSMKAVGVADGPDEGARLLAVCVYHNFRGLEQIDFRDGKGSRPAYGVCEITFAAASPLWASRRTISNLLRIPFLQYNCRKVVTVIPSTNKRAIRFNEGIGLKPEGTLRHHFAKGVHACIHGMMKSEFEQRWKNPRPVLKPNGSQVHGQGWGRQPASSIG